MRMLVALAAVTAGFAVAVSPAAPASAASCGSRITAGGHQWIVAATVSCSVALPVARRLATARVTGHVVRRGVHITTLASPHGWICVTTASNPRGRACSRGVHDTVTLVRLT
jgi:hypothetical protein